MKIVLKSKDNSKIEIQFIEMYKKILAEGVPKKNIKNKMKMDTIDISSINYSPHYLIKKDINLYNSTNLESN
jgi:hypothetical protein